MRLTQSQEPPLELARDQIARFLAPAIARHGAVMDALCAVPGFDYRSFSAARADFGKLARTAEHAARALAEWQENDASRSQNEQANISKSLAAVERIRMRDAAFPPVTFILIGCASLELDALAWSFDDEKYAQVKRHPEYDWLVSPMLPGFEHAEFDILYHHECVDGKDG